MPQLTKQEQEEFLSTPGVLMRLACIRPNGRPLIVPIWFIHLEGMIYFTPRANSEWFQCLGRNLNVALSIDEQNLPYRKVIVEGSAELVHDLGGDDNWRGLYLEMAKRYIPETAETYLFHTIDQERALYQVRMNRADVKTWRIPVEGESQKGMWHKRYYAPGTKLANG